MTKRREEENPKKMIEQRDLLIDLKQKNAMLERELRLTGVATEKQVV